MIKKLRFRSDVARLYMGGLSTRQVADVTGLGKSKVAAMVKAAGLARSRSVAASVRQPARSVHHRSARQAARNLWTQVRGVIPEGMHVHHVNGNYTDNRIDNLELMSAEDHASHHSRGPEYATPRHMRPARREYMRAYLRRYKGGE